MNMIMSIIGGSDVGGEVDEQVDGRACELQHCGLAAWRTPQDMFEDTHTDCG